MSLDFTTYTGLVAACARTLNRSDLEGDIPGWILLAEERHRNDVRIREMLTRVSSEIDDRLIDLPTGFLQMKRLRVSLTSTARPYKVAEITADEMTDKYRAPSAMPMGGVPCDRPLGLPAYFTASDQIEFDCDPMDYLTDEPFADMLYWKALTPLSASVASNALLVRSPGSYLYGTLVHSAPFLLDDARVAIWQGAYTSGVQAINANDRKKSGGPLVARPAGSTP